MIMQDLCDSLADTDGPVKFGVADGKILNHWRRAFSFIQQAASRKAAQGLPYALMLVTSSIGRARRQRR
jgi:hypothetical protein